MSYSDYDPLPGCYDYYEDDNREMVHQEDLNEDDNGAMQHQKDLDQEEAEAINRGKLLECLTEMMKNDSHSYLKLKAEEFLADMKLTIEMELH